MILFIDTTHDITPDILHDISVQLKDGLTEGKQPYQWHIESELDKDKEIQELEEEIESLEKDVDELDDKVDDLEKEVDRLEDKVDDLEDEIDRLNEKLSNT